MKLGICLAYLRIVVSDKSGQRMTYCLTDLSINLRPGAWLEDVF
jgi:hypothetical protein